MREIKMLKSLPVSHDGIAVEMYQEGEKYLVDDNLFDILVNQTKSAIIFQEEKIETKAEVKTTTSIKNMPQVKNKKTYTQEFKNDLVKQCLGSKSATAVARDNNVSLPTLNNWITKAKKEADKNKSIKSAPLNK